MALELTRDMLRVDQIIGEGQSQALVDRDIIVPDIKPDIARILSIEGKVNISNKDVEQDRIAVEGTVDFLALYAADGETQPIYSMEQNASFSQYIDIPKAMPKMEPEVKCEIEHIDFDKLNGRKINIKTVLNLKGKVIDSIPVDAVKEIDGIDDIQFLRDTVVIDEPVTDGSAQIIAKGSIEIPTDLPQAAEVINSRAMINKKDITIDGDNVVLSGTIYLPVIFASRDEVQDIYRVAGEIEFTHTMEMPGIMPEMNLKLDYDIEDVYAELKSDEENSTQSIEAEVVISAKAKATQKHEYPIIIDAYAPSAVLETEMRNITMDNFFGENYSSLILKESMSLPKDTFEIEKVYDAACKLAVTDVKAIEDKVIIEGVAACDVIYLRKGEDRQVDSFSEELPFRSSVVIQGCRADMKPEAYINLEQMDVTMLTKNEVEIKSVIGCTARAYEKVSKDFIIKVDEAEGGVPLHKSSITIYVVQPKDTLWKVAKRYYTTVDDIVRINDIEDPDKIMPGMKLIIPKRLK